MGKSKAEKEDRKRKWRERVRDGKKITSGLKQTERDRKTSRQYETKERVGWTEPILNKVLNRISAEGDYCRA